MKVLHILPSYSISWGGPPQVVYELSKALVKKGVEVDILATYDEMDELLPVSEGINLIKFKRDSFNINKLWKGFSFELLKRIKCIIKNYDILHIHELWHFPHFLVYSIRKDKPYIVTIHGGLEPWCLTYKRLKKDIYSFVIQRRILEEASALHAITEEEFRNICKFTDNKNVVLIPNGLNIENFANLPEKEWFENFYPELKSKKVVLFLGRIHPIKGLDILAKAFGLIVKKRKDVQLVVAGPDSDDYKKSIFEILKVENAMDNTTFTGMLTDNYKLGALSRADVFVLPSYSEGFSVSILEAMACKIPVVITRNCNFFEVEKVGAGRVVSADVNELSGVLIELLDNPKLCNEMGNRGRRLVMEKYSWDKVANDMVSVYVKMLVRQDVGWEGK